MTDFNVPDYARPDLVFKGANRTYYAPDFAELDRSELERRCKSTADRILTRVTTAQDESRDLNSNEVEASYNDRAAITAFEAAMELQDDQARQVQERSKQIGDAIEQAKRPHLEVMVRNRLAVSQETIEEHAKALAEGRPLGRIETVEVFERANQTTLANVGAARQFLDPRFDTPTTLRDFAQIPEGPLQGNALQMPSVTVVGTAGVAETVDHPEQTATPANANVLRYGRWSQVSALVDMLGEITALSAAHKMGISLDLTSLDANAIHTAAGTALAFITNVDQNVRRGVYEVAQATGADPSDLVLIGNAVDLALVTSVTPASGGDRGSVAARVYGARVYPAPIPTGFVTVFSPAHFRVITSRVATASTIGAANGSNTFGTWVHAAPATLFLTGAAKAIDVVTP